MTCWWNAFEDLSILVVAILCVGVFSKAFYRLAEKLADRFVP